VVADGLGGLYGTTFSGGPSGFGALFSVRIDGSGFAVLHSFTGGPSDGAHPVAALILDAMGYLYGTTAAGGTPGPGYGTVFRVRTDGSAFTLLHSFSGGDGGASPRASLTLDGAGNLFGTTLYGGPSNLGTVFKIKTDGTGFAILHTFAGGSSDGASPVTSLILGPSGSLFGTTTSGGSSDHGRGTVFTLRTDGSGFFLLHSFSGSPSDGDSPAGIVMDRAGNLFGTTLVGGSSTAGYGTVFKLRSNGTGYHLLHSFTGKAADGANPNGPSTLDASGNLFVTTSAGGLSDAGTILALNTHTNAVTLLHSFSRDVSDGSVPSAPVVLDASGNLFGTTLWGGAAGLGAVFTVKADGADFRLVHSFWGDVGCQGSAISDASGNLYGTGACGGEFGGGGVFKLKSDGTGYVLLYSFAGRELDGASPSASLTLDGSGTLFGTTYAGGPSDRGSVFKLKTDGTEFVILHFFSGGTDGAHPVAPLALDESGNLFGTTYEAGPFGLGTVFTLTSDGAGFALLHVFGGGASDGAAPRALLTDRAGHLFGATSRGGSSDLGTIFTLNTDGSGFALLHSFTAGSLHEAAVDPSSLVLDDDGNLYGTTEYGGSSNVGMIFKMKSDGSDFRPLHAFSWQPSDGASPSSPLVLGASGRLFGTTSFGGSADFGTVYTLGSDGTGFLLLHSFEGAPSDGSWPSSLTADGLGNLFGTTSELGVEFRLAARPGDANNDGSVDVSDAFYLINALFAGGPSPFAGGDVNGDGSVDLADVFYLINYLFAGGPAPTN
jgi:uncharacterized repeat protein (TIGR03803 family)